MRPGRALERRMADLSAEQVPFVRATVVRARRPTSAHPGDLALVLEDGHMEGFVGGVCAEATVRLQALRALRSGESLLLRISPDPPPDPAAPSAGEYGGTEPHIVDGALVVANPCLSGGELEIFLEPLRPPPTVLVLGDTPIAGSLRALGNGLDYDIRRVAGADVPPEDLTGVAAVVVASHGRDEEALLTLAARAGVPYVALVASGRRGEAVLAGLDLTPGQRSRVRTPAGLWIGARTPGEIAISILAELVATRHGVAVRPGAAPEEVTGAGRLRTGQGHDPAPEPLTAVDPVCGMTVAAVADTPHTDAGGVRRWFCAQGCRGTFEADPARYTEAT